MSELFYIIWPEKKIVTGERIMTWFTDAIANEEIDKADETDDVREAARLLDEAGLITLGRAA